MQQGTFKINASVTDFPVFLDLDAIFRGLKEAGVDGIELVVGIKSRWQYYKIRSLVEKYELPVVTAHQPIWSGLTHFFDTRFVDLPLKLGVKKIVFHPLPFYKTKSRFMQSYFQRLGALQKIFGITVLLENMPQKYGFKIGKYTFPAHDNEFHALSHLLDTANDYNFGITYDASHAKLVKPHEDPLFKALLPRLGNVHLSSFDYREHLPLYMGNFDSRGFLTFLKENNYKGHLTFEIFFPGSFYFTKYDFEAVKKSVAIVRSI